MDIYLVGGAVRDKLLNYPSDEQDWVVVGGTPEQLQAQGFIPVGADFPVFLHPVTKEEYALARTERKSGTGYAGFTFYTSPVVTLENDLIRRDLTINAMAEDHEGNIVDPFNGQKDLDNRILRHVSNAFSEDPVRVLRCARFYARYAHLGFSIAPETLALMSAMVENQEVSHLTAERVWKETEKALHEKNPECYFEALNACGALRIIAPELYTSDVEPTPFTPGQNQHPVICINSLAKNPIIRFCTLFQVIAPQSIDGLSQHLALPNAYRDLLKLCCNEYHEPNAITDISPQALLTRLLKLDPLRKPERFQNFLACRYLIHNVTHLATPQEHSLAALLEKDQDTIKLNDASARIQSIDIASLMAKGLKGKQLGNAIQQARLEQLMSL